MTFALAEFQSAAIEHIVERFTDPGGSRRVLLADEVGLGKTVVARGVIERLLERRRRPLTVIYLCSNTEIAEQNRQKLDPECGAPIGRVTELALKSRDADAKLRLFSFTPGTSLKDGTGLEWERRLLLYLLNGAFRLPVWKKAWREYFRCGVAPERWRSKVSRSELQNAFGRRVSRAFRLGIGAAWRAPGLNFIPMRRALEEAVATFDPEDPESRTERNRTIGKLRHSMQRVALRCLEPDLLILDEVQRFREVIDEAEEPGQIAAELFSRRVPVLILSATPYRAFTLGHELEDGASSHHEDFFRTLEFLFDRDRETPNRVRADLKLFGDRLRSSKPAEVLDYELLELKHGIERDLRKVICRTERNWYVLDRRKGVEETLNRSGESPCRPELEEFFRLQSALGQYEAPGQITEYWKSAPSLLSFLDGKYGVVRKLREGQGGVPSALVSTPAGIPALAERNHRIGIAARVALGEGGAPPRLWTPPTYFYYQDAFFGPASGRKVLVFSGWRFVPKAVAVILSRAASERVGGEDDDFATQPLRFSEKVSFYTFDVCFPSVALARAGEEAFLGLASSPGERTAASVLKATSSNLRRQLEVANVEMSNVSDPIWQVGMRLEVAALGAPEVRATLESWAERARSEGSGESVEAHRDRLLAWIDDAKRPLRISESRLERLALVAAFSPACTLLRALASVFPEESLGTLARKSVGTTLGSLRKYFNRPHVQRIIRSYQPLTRPTRSEGAEAPRFAERVLQYSRDGHLQAVLDEYAYLLRHAAQASSSDMALEKLERVWGLARGNPRTNGLKGSGTKARLELEAHVHPAHYALGFGDDSSQEGIPEEGEDRERQRKSIVREAFNSPFWPFVLATTSVGQEGLDFHLYCRAILHWNLPWNPVDLEQREGRLNRRDCLAIRESIAKDWPLRDLESASSATGVSRNPWLSVFDRIETGNDPQNHKHGLFPHWIYECRDPQNTVRIQRYVPYFATSRDAKRYESLKAGLALYRLVFGQMNQEDLLEKFQQQLEDQSPQERDRTYRRLASYMLNLSPLTHDKALARAKREAESILSCASGREMALQLVAATQAMRAAHALDLAPVARELDDLVALVQDFADGSDQGSAPLVVALRALAYLRNPYDRIFDLHVEAGFSDDVEVIREEWGRLQECDEPLDKRGLDNGGVPSGVTRSS